MYLGYRVVCVTPAGRRRYMKLLAPYVLRSPIVDEYQIWANTRDEDDLEFFRCLARADARVTIVEAPDHHVSGTGSTIGQFFRGCIDSGSVYIRFDDDIVYLNEGFFETLLKFRIENPRYFIVSPLVINNALCSFISQIRSGRHSAFGYIRPNVYDGIAWQSPVFAYHLHDEFLRQLAANSLGALRFERQEFGLCRFSINCISWLGGQFAEFGGVVPRGADEEEWISAVKPTELGLANCVHGMAIAGHFAFHTQREYLDTTDLLARYEQLCIDTIGPAVEALSGGLIEMRQGEAASTGPGFAAQITSDLLKKRLKERLEMAINQGATWTYARSDGPRICTELRLLPNGEIAGYQHVNEDKWEIADGVLCFLAKSGKVSTRFDRMIEIDGQIRAVGCYLFDTVSWEHILELNQV
jgi:hypothetical protein